MPRIHLQRVCIALAAGFILPVSISGCASDRLDASSRGGVDLSGRWKYNPYLSDDADKQADGDKDQSRSPESSSRRRGNRGGPGGAPGVPPYGDPRGNQWRSDNRQSPPIGSSVDEAETGRLLTVGLPPSAPDASVGLPPPGPESAPGMTGRGGRISRLLPAATYLLITQDGARINIKANMPDGTVASEEYTAGQKVTVPMGDSTAERVMGWRGPIFVVTTTAKKGGEMEVDYALDDDGRLIVATELRAGRMKKPVDIKRVYDRADRSESGR